MSPGLPDERLPLSVTIVCCNNEETIRRCVESVVHLASEIIAVDSGSTDGTPGILRGYDRVRLIEQPWLGYVRQKQFALDRCTCPWVLHLDSDESVERDLARSIEAFIRRDDEALAGACVNRKVWYRGRPLNHAWQPEWRLRLIRRGRAHWGGLDPHDALMLDEPGASTTRLRGDLRHDAIPSIAQFLARQAAHARLSAESAHRSGRTSGPVRLVTSPIAAWTKQMVVRRAFLDGWRGWLAATAGATAAAMKHAVLIELGRGHDADPGGGTTPP